MTSKGYFYRMKKLLQLVHEVCPSYLPLTIAEQAIQQGRTFLSMFLGAEILDGVIRRQSEQEILQTALFLVLSNMILALVQWAIDKVCIVKRRETDDKVNAAIAHKCLVMDYQVAEKAETREYLTQINEGMQFSGGISQFCENIAYIASAMLGTVYSACAFVPLCLSGMGENREGIARWVNSWYGSVIFVFIVMATILYTYLQNSKINENQHRNFKSSIHFNRVYSYFCGYISDYQSGKGIRIYDMCKLIKSVIKRWNDKTAELWIWNSRKYSFYQGGINIARAVMLVASYFYVGVKVLSGTVSVGKFTFYAGVVNSLSQSVGSILSMYSFLQMTTRYLVYFAEFLELPNEKYDGTLPVEKRLDNDYELEFRNVSFHYPNSNDLVLKNVTAKIRVGRKMAIVGRNGSGKSTFIKLLCRLYDPTEGEILLNGIDIRKYDYDEYRLLFGVVFQDFQLFSFPLAQNVASGIYYDEKKVWETLGKAGMAERVKSMEKGVDTVIYKQDDEGVEISGGEAQKIAIARALYKDAPVVILDEPTAALDPVSELEIYERFDEMVQEKTAIYISHRMSSCRFCENILVFDDGNIVQMGSHETLVGREGLYAELWRAQAQYYQ